MSASRELQRQLKRIEPCLPRPAAKPPAGPGWIHEIKHDGYRIMAERNHGSVRLYTRNGYDFADRFPLAAAARIGADKDIALESAFFYLLRQFLGAARMTPKLFASLLLERGTDAPLHEAD
jgi:hypothetical protein